MMRIEITYTVMTAALARWPGIMWSAAARARDRESSVVAGKSATGELGVLVAL
jgi:hypothetical protein